MADMLTCPYCGLEKKSYFRDAMDAHIATCPKRPVTGDMPAPPIPAQVDLVEEFQHAIERETPLSLLTPTVQVASPSSNGLYIPDLDKAFQMQQDMIRDMERIEAMSREHPVNVLLIGKQGAGKSSMAEQFAAHYQRLCYVVPCVTMQEQAQWWGIQQVNPERGTFYLPSEFVKAVETPRCVVILDDMNRVENPKVLNPLFGILDYHRQTFLDDMQRYVKVADGVVIFGTVNEGWAFQGTDPIDAALRDRFDQIEVPYPPRSIIGNILSAKTRIDYATAAMIADFASDLSEHRATPVSISMRTLLRMAEHMAFGATLQESVKFCMQASLEPKEIENVLAILQTKLQDKYTAEVPGWTEWK